MTYTGAAKTVWFRVRLSPPRSAPVPQSALSLDPVIAPNFWVSFEQGRELSKLDFDGLVRHTERQAVALIAQLMVPRLAAWCAVFPADPADGLSSLLAGCRDLSAGAVAARIQRAVSEFGAEPPSDDMAVLVLRATCG